MQATQFTSATATVTLQTPAVIKRIHDIPPLSSAAAFTSSAGQISFGDEDVDVVTEKDLKPSDHTLEAR